MDSGTKTIFTKINNSDTYFSEIIEKVTKNFEITSKEYSYILSLSTLFYDEYLRKEKNGYLEFSYYLVLNYSIMTNDYNPLLMFSINNGLYPIAKSIFSNYEMNIQDILYNTEIDFYKKKNIYELKKQYETRQKALLDHNQFMLEATRRSIEKGVVMQRLQVLYFLLQFIQVLQFFLDIIGKSAILRAKLLKGVTLNDSTKNG